MDANHDIITALSPTKRDPGRLTIKVAGRAVATMQAKRIAELGLEIGMPWTDALAEQVAHAAAFDKAMRAAMNRLNRRAMSRSQLRRKLTDRKLELDVAAVDAALDRLEELDLIDDEAFGRALIAEILRGRPAGPMLLRQKLMQRGLERNLIDRLIAENEPSEEAAIEGAVKLATTKLRSLQRYDAATRKRRLWGMLQRRGFSSDIITSTLSQLDGLDDEPFD